MHFCYLPLPTVVGNLVPTPFHEGIVQLGEIHRFLREYKELLNAVFLIWLGQILIEKNAGEFPVSGDAISVAGDARTGGKDPESGEILWKCI